MFDLSLYELLEAILLLVSVVIVFASSLKLFTQNQIPNSKWLLISVTGLFIGLLVIPMAEAFHLIEESESLNSFLAVYLGAMYMIGAYGFWSLTRYSINMSSNK